MILTNNNYIYTIIKNDKIYWNSIYIIIEKIIKLCINKYYQRLIQLLDPTNKKAPKNELLLDNWKMLVHIISIFDFFFKLQSK